MNLLPLIKTNPWKRGRELGVATEANRKKKKVHVTEGKHKLEDRRLHPFMTILTSSAKEARKRKEVSFTVDLSIRDPLQLQQEVLRPVLHIQGGRCCIWKQIPNILLSPTERETLRRRTERKRWVNQLYLLPSQSIWPRLQPRKSWLEKPSSQFCVPLVEKQREVGGGEGDEGSYSLVKEQLAENLKA